MTKEYIKKNIPIIGQALHCLKLKQYTIRKKKSLMHENKWLYERMLRWRKMEKLNLICSYMYLFSWYWLLFFFINETYSFCGDFNQDLFFRYEYDDHYFLTDPKEFIYEFFPLQPEWQLLKVRGRRDWVCIKFGRILVFIC